MRWSIIGLCLCLAAWCAVSMAASGKRTLVVIHDLKTKDTHSRFFKSLEDRGYQLHFETTDHPSIALQKHGEYLYEHLILFAPTLDDALEAEEVVEFIDDGHNVLLAADTGASNIIRDIAEECGVEFAESTTAVIDHFNFAQSDFDGYHTLVIAENVLDAPVILGGKKFAPILFRGIGQEVREGPLNFRLLSASSTAYSGRIDGKSGSPKLLGKKNTLVSALQARNNARVVISGSLELFSDELFLSNVQKYDTDGKAKTQGLSGNEQFATELSKWVFQERGVLRIRDVNHSLKGSNQSNIYTIKDDITFSVIIEELVNGQWVPYKANDVQLEFIMIDPYVRTNLTHDGKGKYSTSFKVPDVYGVFTFKVDYHRIGYSALSTITRVPVRPFRHDQYERFIPSAFPYYAGAFSMLIGLFVFSIVFLYHSDSKAKKN